MIAAARDDIAPGNLAIVCNELTADARAGLIDGVLTAVISTPTALLAERAVAAMEAAISSPQDPSKPPFTSRSSYTSRPISRPLCRGV